MPVSHFFRSIIFTCALATAASAVAEPRAFVIGVEDYPNFLPYSEFKDGAYRGLGRAILDAFAKDKGYTFDYRVLPLKRRDRMFVDGELDMAFPDNPNWIPDVKKGVRVHYAPMLEFTDGVLVKREAKGSGLKRMKVLGVPLGFTPYPYQRLMNTGAIRIEESMSYDSLYEKLLVGRVDGAYMNTRIASYYWTKIRQARDVPIVFDPDLPHASGYWYASSVKYPWIIDEFDAFMKSHKPLIDSLKKRYDFQSDAP